MHKLKILISLINFFFFLFLVRTWDGGKSHLTKQVEDDKRSQRKRTADDLVDEEMDKGKVSKKKKHKHNIIIDIYSNFNLYF